MPCDTITRYETDFTNAPTGPEFQAALKSLELSGDARYFSGWITIDGRRTAINGSVSDKSLTIAGRYLNTDQLEKASTMIRTAYSQQIVKAQAQRFGWTVKQEGQKTILYRR